ncbi:MAG: galactose-1-phosphate uridylyltransferase, partial [Butyricicoccus porcorum]|nr:galactose-1-phosphate uridylyltransferase [Butyricicoccus porcorum]
DWADELKTRYSFTADNAMDIVQKEVGVVFSKVLEHAGVFKRDEAGKTAFLRFVQSVS